MKKGWCWRDGCPFPAMVDGDVMTIVFIDDDDMPVALEPVCLIHAPWRRWALNSAAWVRGLRNKNH